MIKRYVITSAQCAAGVNSQLLETLQGYCSHNKADLIVLKMPGKTIREDILSSSLGGFDILDGSYKLNRKISIKKWNVKPQQIRPLTGLARFTKRDHSTIIASPKQELRTVPNTNKSGKFPKLLLTTGAVTHPRYNLEHRVGTIAKEDHKYGALVVEIVNDTAYHVRHLAALKNGKVYDMGTLYDGKNVIEGSRLELMVLGDWHTGDTDSKVAGATIKMIEEFQPKGIVLHDFFNGHSINHHNAGRIIELYQDYKESGRSLEMEVSECAEELKEFLQEIPKDSKIYIVKSNHDIWLDRYLNEGRFIKEPQNVKFASMLLHDIIDGADPLKTAISYFMDVPNNVEFLEEGSDKRVLGWYIGFHGHQGANGARAGKQTYEDAGERTISGHLHYPELYRNNVRVGTSTKLELRYNSGGVSSWFNTHAFLHPNGKPQLINIIDGFWKGV